jgi:hypothetical protein
MSASWGNPTWTFFHTLADHISDSSFDIVGKELINVIERICRHLPCPECTEHATIFWGRVNKQSIKTSQDLRNILFMFHNIVNKRKHKPPFLKENLTQYNHINIVLAYKNFLNKFHTNGNMSLISNAFHRTRMLAHLKIWFNSNLHHFINRKIETDIEV